jgi:hypothetical protein
MGAEVPEGAGAEHRRTRPWLAPVVLAAVFGLWWGGQQAWTSYENRSPFPPSAVHVRLTLTSIPTEQAQPLLDRLTGGRHLTPTWSGGEGAAAAPQLVGQLTFDGPANAPAGSRYVLFLVDERDSGHPTPSLYGWAGAALATGWDGRYDQIPRRYPDLGGLGMVQLDAGFTAPGASLSFGPRTTGPVTISAVSVPTGLRADDVSPFHGVLAFFGANQHLYWATQVPVTGIG